MKTLKDYENMTRAEICYTHLVTSCLLFKNELIQVIYNDEGVTCKCKSKKTERVFEQVYYFTSIYEKDDLIELIQNDTSLCENTEFEFLTRKRRNYN